MGAIVTSDRWGLSPARLAELESHGLTMVNEDPIKGLAIKDVQSGEVPIGELTHEEALIFRALWDLRTLVDGIDRGIQGDMMAKLGEVVRSHDAQEPTVVVEHREIAPEWDGDQKASYFASRQQAGYLHALLHYTLGQRFQLHHWVLGVRAGGVVVKVLERPIGA